MKRTTIPVLSMLLLMVILACGSCKEAEVETGTVTVIVSEGVSGSPITGTYTVQVGDTWAYSYSLDAGYTTLTVLLDGTAVEASGLLTITGSHTLQAYADDNLQYTLTVSWGEGVSGTPVAGTYRYKQGTVIPYSYALLDGYTDLVVLVDGEDADVSGSITMSEDFTLHADAEVKYDVRGPWKLTEVYDDGSEFEVTLTFSGTLTGGTVTDSEGGTGTYEFTDDTVDFNLVFPDVTYEYSDGSFDDENTMSGDCERYQVEDDAIDGSWTATRITATASAPHKAAGAKRRFQRK